MRLAPKISLTGDERVRLGEIARAKTTSPRHYRQCQILLLADEGFSDVEIAARLGINRFTAARCRRRFLKEGLPGVGKIAPGRGRKPDSESKAKILRLAAEKAAAGESRSTRALAAEIGVSASFVHKVKREAGTFLRNAGG